VLSDENAHAYLSITARASVIRDPVQAKEVWKKTDDVWWPDGPGDAMCACYASNRSRPSSGMGLRVQPLRPLIAKARLTGEKPNLGEKRKVTVPMQ